VPEPPEVTCEPTGEFACVPIVTACTSDSSCLAGWSCADNPNGACTRTPEGEIHCVADPAKICVPPHSGYPGNGGPGEGTTTGLPEAPGSNPPNNSGTPEPAGAPGGGDPLDAAAPESNTSSSGGCSMSPVPTPPSALALVALGLAAAFGFRRRR
jgi:MYXO-CTERM domain-containing protein